MKTDKEIRALLSLPGKELEAVLKVKFRNGQGPQAARAALRWVLS